MRVLLTRAVDDAARTRSTLEGFGHRVFVSPVIEIVPLAADWPGGIVDGILATSGQAFVAAADYWGPSPEARRLVPLWLVGTRTRDVALQRGFLGATFVAQNTVALVFEMNKRLGRQRVIYLAGRDRKPDIETALAVTEQPAQVVEIYEARPASELTAHVRSLLASRSIEAALHFSRRSAALFQSLVAASDLPPPARNVCLSDDVATPLRNAGWPTQVAREPTEQSLFASLAEIT